MPTPRTFTTTQLRDVVAARLRACSEITQTGAKILTRERASLPGQIAELVSSLQLALIVPPAICVKANPNTAPLVMDDMRVTVRVVETALNKSGFEAEQLAELVLSSLHSWQLPVAVPGQPVLFATENPMEPGSSEDVYFVDCHFHTLGGISLPGEDAGEETKYYTQAELDAAVAAAKTATRNALAAELSPIAATAATLAGQFSTLAGTPNA